MPDPHLGMRPSNCSKKADPARFWKLLCFICISLLFASILADSLRSWQEESQLSRRGILVSGVITSRRQYNSVEASSSHYISYRFSVSRPNIINYYSREERVDYYIWKALDGVRFVNIYFLPENPRVSRLELPGRMPLKNAKKAMVVIILSAILSVNLLTVVSIATGWAPFAKKREWVLGADGIWRSR